MRTYYFIHLPTAAFLMLKGKGAEMRKHTIAFNHPNDERVNKPIKEDGNMPSCGITERK